MSAAERVGSWPEILSLIIEFLEFDRAGLYAAHLVNTTWAHYARKVLWRNAPLSSLAAIEPSRQQHYANMIRISLSWDMRYPAELDKLSFPSLERCLLDMAQIFELSDYRLVLPPFFKTSTKGLPAQNNNIQKTKSKKIQNESQVFKTYDVMIILEV